MIYFSYRYSRYSDKNIVIFCACAFVLTCVLSMIFSNMAAVGEQLTKKCGTKSPVCNYFSLLTDENGKCAQPDNLVCKICHTQVQAKSGNNLLSHLKNKELKAKMEEKEREKCDSKIQAKNQPTLSSVITRNQPYQSNGVN